MRNYRNQVIKLFLILSLISFGLGWFTPETLAAVFNATDSVKLRQALLAAEGNRQADTIILSARTYLTGGTPFVYNAQSGENFPLTINGAGRDMTTLDGGNRGRALQITTSLFSQNDPDAQITIRNLTIRNGTLNSGSGIGLFVQTFSATVFLDTCRFSRNLSTSANVSGVGASISTVSGFVSIFSNIFTDNSATLNGGGLNLSINNGAVFLLSNTFDNNSADIGGGARISGNSGRVDLEDNTFTNNFAGLRGGGVSIDTGSGGVGLRSNELDNNLALESGGGAEIVTTSGNISLFSNTLTDNSTENGSGGGVIILSDSGDIFMSSNTLIGNSAPSGSGGGALVNADSLALVSSNSFLDNSSGNNGGGLDLSSGTGNIGLNFNIFTGNSCLNNGGGANIGSSRGITIQTNLFNMNSADNGGGALVGSQGDVTLTSNAFTNNSAVSEGGGASVFTTSGIETITNNTFTGNSAELGGGLRAAPQFILGNTAINIFNNIIRGNTATGVGDDILADDASDTFTGIPVNLFNNIFSDFFSVCENTAVDCTPDISRGSNINQNPLLVDATNGDVHLRAGSPAINRGSPTAPGLPPQDFDLDSRVFDSLPDMGADEALTCNGRFPTIIGTQSGEIINGTTGPDVILGLRGNDTISGSGGGDRICGGDDNDTINGDGGTDFLFGERGNDTINGGPSNDQIFGGANDDTLNGGADTDTCDFGGGQVSGTATNCETVTDTMSGFSGVWTGDVTQTCDASEEDLVCAIEGTLEVENPGVDTAEQSLLRFFLSFDELLDEEDVLIQETLVDPLEPLEAVEVNLQEQLPPGQDAIGQFIIALLDATDVVSEINEENNVVVSSAIVGEGGSGGCAMAALPADVGGSAVSVFILLIPAFAVGFRAMMRRRSEP